MATKQYLCRCKFPGHDSGTAHPCVRLLTASEIRRWTADNVNVENMGQVRVVEKVAKTADARRYSLLTLAHDPTLRLRAWSRQDIERMPADPILYHPHDVVGNHPYPDWYRQAMKEWLS